METPSSHKPPPSSSEPTWSTKKCSKCGEEKPTTAFHNRKDDRSKTGLMSRCKVCRREGDRASKARCAEKTKLSQSAWRAAHAEHLRQRGERRRVEKRAMCLVASARIRARRLGVPFTLCEEDIQQIQRVIDDGRCELSGAFFELVAGKGKRARSPSLDRIEPSKGYTSENVRVVCLCLNAGMGHWGEEALRDVVQEWLAGGSSPRRRRK